jgi:antitoxin (DNA-binding transcriptional repressor) of toxin-antitoxin stability system
MKAISVAELRQNPTAALDQVEQGATFVVTRHRREVARLVPPLTQRHVTAGTFAEVLRATPLRDDWGAEVAAARKDLDDADDPWTTSA